MRLPGEYIPPKTRSIDSNFEVARHKRHKKIKMINTLNVTNYT